MSLTPFIKWYTDDSVIVRGHGLGEDVLYLCGDKPARYLVPAIPMYVELTKAGPTLVETYNGIDVFVYSPGDYNELLNW